MLSDTAALVERVSYDAYGMARHHHAADINSDGVVTQVDYDMVTQNLGNFGVGNITRTGTDNSRDQSWANDSRAALPPGEISKTDNIVGYAGYLFNAEIHGAGMYTVRHRHYAPDLGRWLTRDPIGYVDGMSLYEYVPSSPIRFSDSMGLSPQIWVGLSALQVSWISILSRNDIVRATWSIHREFSIVDMRAFLLTAGLATTANPDPPAVFTPQSFGPWDQTKEHRGWS